MKNKMARVNLDNFHTGEKAVAAQFDLEDIYGKIEDSCQTKLNCWEEIFEGLEFQVFDSLTI